MLSSVHPGCPAAEDATPVDWGHASKIVDEPSRLAPRSKSPEHGTNFKKPVEEPESRKSMELHLLAKKGETEVCSLENRLSHQGC